MNYRVENKTSRELVFALANGQTIYLPGNGKIEKPGFELKTKFIESLVNRGLLKIAGINKSKAIKKTTRKTAKSMQNDTSAE